MNPNMNLFLEVNTNYNTYHERCITLTPKPYNKNRLQLQKNYNMSTVVKFLEKNPNPNDRTDMTDRIKIEAIQKVILGQKKNEKRERNNVFLEQCFSTSRCQFHQNFTGAFFVQKSFEQLFSA